MDALTTLGKSICELCGKQFVSDALLTKHLAAKHENGDLPNDHCELHFTEEIQQLLDQELELQNTKNWIKCLPYGLVPFRSINVMVTSR